MREETTFAHLPFRVEEWTADCSAPLALMAAAADQDVALAMARAARPFRLQQRIRLFGRPITEGLEPRHLSDPPFHVELWRQEPRGLERVIAASTHVLVARAGFRAAIALFPLPILLRHGAHVLADTAAGDA